MESLYYFVAELVEKRGYDLWDKRAQKYLWIDMKYVRDISFTNAEIINLGNMTKEL